MPFPQTFAVEPTPPNVCETLTVTWQNNATSPIGITGASLLLPSCVLRSL